ncbi:MAG: GTPase HflX [Acidimicrobiales bacterium]
MTPDMSLIERHRRETVVLVGVALGGADSASAQASLDELAALADTAGADEAARVLQRREAPDPATFVGKGKAAELRELSEAVDADTVIFDDELSPAQSRNLEKLLGRTAIDRAALILDIFAQHAHTQEGKAQVELALLRYRLPRLRGKGVGLSQQEGRIGTRGPGETQLEVDRRRLLRRVTRLEADLVELARHRGVQRKARVRSGLAGVALVGYTNAGKSTLLNALTSAHVLAEDRLFATVDPTTRRLDLPGGERVLLTDTVGFVRKLPHQLVDAFHSTLDEVRQADLLLHVVDASAADPEGQMEAVSTVLAEIGADQIPVTVVLNKTDQANPDSLADLLARYPDAVTVSGLTGEGLNQLASALACGIRSVNRVVRLAIPYDRGDLVAFVHRAGEVLELSHGPAVTDLLVRIPEADLARVAEWMVTDRPGSNRSEGSAKATDEGGDIGG